MKIKNLNESYLTEETVEQAAEKEAAAIARGMGPSTDIENWDGPYGNVEEALDNALQSALDAREFGETSDDNVLLVGRAGTGKTERIKNWAKQRGILLHMTDVQTLDPTDLAGIVARNDEDPKFVTRLGNTEFKDLDDPNRPAVLFLDEINRAGTEVLGALLTLVQNHLIVDPTAEGHKRPLRGMLFTVSAMNPYNPNYDVNDLDMAMRTRLGKVQVEVDNEFQKEFYDNYFTKTLEKLEGMKDNPNYERLKKKLTGQANLAKTIMNSPMFRFDDDEEENQAKLAGEATLNPRTLTAALKSCDGTKDHFLKIFLQKCNPDKYDMMDSILQNYVDVDDKANDALKYGDENPFAEKQASIWGKVEGQIPKEYRTA